MTIVINGEQHHRPRGSIFSYETIVQMALGYTSSDPEGYTVTYHGKGDLGEYSGTLTKGGSLVPSPGAIFNVAYTVSA
jgi:hypothetical protein